MVSFAVCFVNWENGNVTQNQEMLFTGRRERCGRAEPLVRQQSWCCRGLDIRGQPRGVHEARSSLTCSFLTVGRGERRRRIFFSGSSEAGHPKQQAFCTGQWGRAGDEWSTYPAKRRVRWQLQVILQLLFESVCNSPPLLFPSMPGIVLSQRTSHLPHRGAGGKKLAMPCPTQVSL